MPAQDDVIELRVAHELEGAAHPTALGQRGRLLNLQATIPRERLHRLHAPEIWARVDRGDLERLEDVDERLGLLHALLAEGADTVVAFPVAPAAGLGVADEIENAHQVSTGVAGAAGFNPAATWFLSSAKQGQAKSLNKSQQRENEQRGEAAR